MADLTGRVALVTGAGRGMGRASAERIAADGARVVVNDLDETRATEVADRLAADGAEAVGVAADVADAADVRRLVDTTRGRFGDVDILVNNAGVLRRTGILALEEDEWDLVLNVNLKGTYLCTRAVLPAMKEAGWGRVVNISSSAGRSVSTLGGPHYTTAKAAVLGFTRAVAKEMAPFGITLNAVCPGLVNTEMVSEVYHRRGGAGLRRQLPDQAAGGAARGGRAGRLPGLGQGGIHNWGVARHQRRRSDALTTQWRQT